MMETSVNSRRQRRIEDRERRACILHSEALQRLRAFQRHLQEANRKCQTRMHKMNNYEEVMEFEDGSRMHNIVLTDMRVYYLQEGSDWTYMERNDKGHPSLCYAVRRAANGTVAAAREIRTM